MSDITALAAPRKSEGVAILLVAATCFGLNIPFAGLAGRMGLPGPDVVAIRVLFMLLVAGIYIWQRGMTLHVERADRGKLLALGLASALVSIAYVSSIAFVPVGVAAMVFYTFPLVIMLASPFVEKVRLTALLWLACALAFSGIALAIGPSFSALDWRGLALAFCASLAAASQFFLGARAPGGGGLVMIFWLQLIILPFAVGTSLVLGGPAPIANFQGAITPLSIATLGAAIGIVCQFVGMPRIGATAAGLIFCLEPIISTLFSGWLLGDVLYPTQYIGGLLVLCGIILSILQPVRRAAP